MRGDPIRPPLHVPAGGVENARVTCPVCKCEFDVPPNTINAIQCPGCSQMIVPSAFTFTRGAG